MVTSQDIKNTNKKLSKIKIDYESKWAIRSQAAL